MIQRKKSSKPQIEKVTRNFKGVWIPKKIWLHPDLTWMEKLFLVEIDSLDNGKSGCFASNKHFSSFFNLSIARCSQIISSLRDKGFIRIKMERKGKEIVKRHIFIKQGVFNILKGGIKYSKGGYLENYKGNNTSINNTVLEKNIDHLDGFDEWYDNYPRKVSKGAAKKAWIKIQKLPSKKRPSLSVLLKAVNEQKKSEQWQNKKYIPHPSTWLNKEKWLDEIETNSYNSNKTYDDPSQYNPFDDDDDYIPRDFHELEEEYQREQKQKQIQRSKKYNPRNPHNHPDLPGFEPTDEDLMYMNHHHDPFDDD